MGLTYYIEHIESRMVVDVKESRAENGASVVLYKYHGGPNQLWTYKNGMLQSALGKNLVLDINEREKKINLYTAHGGANQKWTVNDDSTITSGTGHALDISNGIVASGVSIIPYSKHGGSNQKFRLIAKN